MNITLSPVDALGHVIPRGQSAAQFSWKRRGGEREVKVCTGKACSFKAKQIQTDLWHRPQEPGLGQETLLRLVFLVCKIKKNPFTYLEGLVVAVVGVI